MLLNRNAPASILLYTLMLIVWQSVSAQNFALYNTRTLYDTFENPSQSAFQVDSSRKIAFNFLIPTITANTHFVGPADVSLKAMLYSNKFYGEGLDIEEKRMNHFNLHSNNYIGMLRIMRQVKNYQEIGLSWQIKAEGQVDLSNASFILFDDYRYFEQAANTNLFNNKGYAQSYHQFSLSYRQAVDKRLSVGFKASLL